MVLNHRQKTRRIIGTLAGLGLLTAGAGAVQAYSAARLTRVGARLPGLLSPLRVALLSDLHYGPYVRERQVGAWVDLTLSACSDLVLVAGDFCDVPLGRGLPAPLLRQLARLRAPLGVYGVWGNHDYGSFGQHARPLIGAARPGWEAVRATFEAALAGAGLQVLTNAGRLLRGDVWLGGVDDLGHGAPDARAALRGAPQQAAQLLMVHEPDALMTLAAAPEWRPGGLAVCGHTHGGQVRLPLLGAPVLPSRYGQRFAEGWVLGEPAHGRPGARGYVSRGLGVSGLPVRLFCPPEVVLLELTPV